MFLKLDKFVPLQAAAEMLLFARFNLYDFGGLAKRFLVTLTAHGAPFVRWEGYDVCI